MKNKIYFAILLFSNFCCYGFNISEKVDTSEIEQIIFINDSRILKREFENKEIISTKIKEVLDSLQIKYDFKFSKDSLKKSDLQILIEIKEQVGGEYLLVSVIRTIDMQVLEGFRYKIRNKLISYDDNLFLTLFKPFDICLSLVTTNLNDQVPKNLNTNQKLFIVTFLGNTKTKNEMPDEEKITKKMIENIFCFQQNFCSYNLNIGNLTDNSQDKFKVYSNFHFKNFKNYIELKIKFFKDGQSIYKEKLEFLNLDFTKDVRFNLNSKLNRAINKAINASMI